MEGWPWSWREMGGVMLDPASWTQWLLLAVAWAAAWALNRYWIDHVGWQRDPSHKLREVTINTGTSVLQPFAFLVLILMERAVLRKLDWDREWLDVAVPLVISFAVIRALIFLLREALSPSRTLRVWETAITNVVWGIVALKLLGWLPAIESALDQIALDVGHFHISILGVINVAFGVALFLLLAVWVARMVERRVDAVLEVEPGIRVMIGKLIRTIFVAAAFLVALEAIGVDITALTVLSGAIGVGVGFGLQRITSNFIAGFILLFDRAIKPGDVISLGDRNEYGWVKQLRARYIVVRQRDGVERLIPNEQLMTNEVRNWTYDDPRVSISVPVQVGYQDDVEQAMQILTECAVANTRVLRDPAPAAYLNRFADSGIELSLMVWIGDPQNGLGNVISDLNLEIWRAFKRKGVSMPFPQRDVRVTMAQAQLPANKPV